MPFESLSYRHTIHLDEIPHRWLPLIHLYDADLPLFPIYYFHIIRENLPQNSRPLHADRAFGYVEHIKICEEGGIDVGLVVNKNLSDPANIDFSRPVETEIRERFGISDPVTLNDVTNAFQPPLNSANAVLTEMWHRVVANAYGNLLPFGRLWDEVLGLTRFVASWNAPGERKSELIQTHYFMKIFGEPINAASGIPQVDFHLLPTSRELLDITNPLTDFPRFRDLLSVADIFAQFHGTRIAVGGLNLTRFNNPIQGKFNSQALFEIINGVNIPHAIRPAAAAS